MNAKPGRKQGRKAEPRMLPCGQVILHGENCKTMCPEKTAREISLCYYRVR